MKRDLAAFRVSQKQETVTEERNRSRRIQRTRFSATLNDAAGQQRVEVHGEVVDGSTAGFGNILGAGARPPVKESGDVADPDALFASHFDNAMASGNGGNDGIKISVDADLRAPVASERGVAGPAVGVANGQRGHAYVVLGEISAVVARAVAFAQFLHVDDAGLQANRGAKIHN